MTLIFFIVLTHLTALVIKIFSSDFESVSAYHLTGKNLIFDFYPKGVYIECKFWFHGPPLLTFKTDRLDLRVRSVHTTEVKILPYRLTKLG